MTEIAISDLKELCHKALLNTGLSEEHTQITIDHFLENECSGKASHGMVRVVEAVHYINKTGVNKNDISIAHDNNHICVLEAERHLGTVAAKRGMDECIARTKEHGMAFVGIRNYFVSTGSMAYYLRRFVEQGLVAIIGCNSVALVAPPNGKTRTLGTNPLGMGFPSADGNHFIGDIATSAIAYGKVMVAKDKGEDVPEGKMIDKDGLPSINPADAYDGAILPLADYHGFSVALMIALLGGTIIGAKDLKQNIYDGDGFFMIGIDPKAFGNDNAPNMIQNTLEQIRQTATRPNHDSVSIPGDRSAKALKETLERGTVDVAETTLSNLKELAA